MRSEIQQFYKNQTIFLTGGSGGLGVLLLDVLLRLCDVNKIFLMLRPKKGKRPEERLDAIFSDVYFDTLKKEKPEFKTKLVVINGDLEQSHLGISEDNRNILRTEATIVIHSAANVRFDQPLKQAAQNNVLPVREMLDLAKTISNLKAYVHVSTSFCNCTRSPIGEKLYEPPMTAENLMTLIDSLDDETLTKITPKLIEGYFNTYLFTKTIGEDLVRREGKNLPLVVIRPAIILPTSDGPCPGWINNFYGPIGLGLGMFLGIIRSIWLEINNICYLVPCDYVANCLIAAVFDVYTRQHKKRFSKLENDLQPNSGNDSGDIAIYNYVGSSRNLITWAYFIGTLSPHYWNYALSASVWYRCCIITSNKLVHNIASFLFQTIPSHIFDFILKCFGQPPIFVKIYEKLENSKITELIMLKDWAFESDNVDKLWQKLNEEDKKLFKFDMTSFDWSAYLERGFAGCRATLLKDPLDTIPRAKVKLVLLGILHYSLIALFLYGIFRLIMLFIH